MLHEGVGAVIIVVDGESAVAELGIIRLFVVELAVVDVVVCVHGHGIVDEEGAVGIDDASRSA